MGGGIFNGFGDTLTLIDSSVSGNTSTGTGSIDGGGGIYNSPAATIVLTRSSVTENGAPGAKGQGIYTRGALLQLTDSTVASNFSLAGRLGGGIYVQSSTATLTNSTVEDNWAFPRGGGIYNESGTVSLTNTTISGNSIVDVPTQDGHAIWNEPGGTISATRKRAGRTNEPRRVGQTSPVFAFTPDNSSLCQAGWRGEQAPFPGSSQAPGKVVIGT